MWDLNTLRMVVTFSIECGEQVTCYRLLRPVLLTNNLSGRLSGMEGPVADVGPCRLRMSTVVTRVAEALGLNILILNCLVLVQVVESVWPPIMDIACAVGVTPSEI